MADRKKWKGIVRQAKAHSRLQCQWKKKKKKKKNVSAVANSVMVEVYLHDFYNNILKIKRKLYIVSG